MLQAKKDGGHKEMPLVPKTIHGVKALQKLL
jgi:hypothetical protein